MVNTHSTPSTSTGPDTSTVVTAAAAVAIMSITRTTNNNNNNNNSSNCSGSGQLSSTTSSDMPSPLAHMNLTHTADIAQLTALQRFLSHNCTVVAASCAAVTSVFCGFPFDSVKTRMQTHNYRSLSDCVRKTYRVEGVRGFFRGIVPPLLTVSALRTTSFSVYERTKANMRSLYGHPNSLFNLGVIAFVAGGASGAAVAALSCPFELVKIQRQLQVLVWERQVKELRRTQMDPHASSEARMAAQHAQQRLVDPRNQPTWASVQEIIRLRGPRGLFYGLQSHLIRDLAGTGTYFAGYECTKRTLASIEGDDKTSSGVHFLAGGLAGVFCWLLTFPLDLVKSLIQKDVTAIAIIGSGPGGPITIASHTKSNLMNGGGGSSNSGSNSQQQQQHANRKPIQQNAPSGWRVARNIVGRSGFRGLYTGISVTLIRAFPIHALNFTVYEYVTERIRLFTTPPTDLLVETNE